MKTKNLCLIAFLLLAVATFTGTAEAQTTTYSTTTSAALNATQLCFIVASTTSMSASGALTGPGGAPQEWDLWTDGEWMKINTVNTTSNQVCVMRGKSPTRAGIHATGQVLFFGPAGVAPFIQSAPLTTSPGVLGLDGQFGSCVSTNYLYLPLINVVNGSIWNCLTSARGTRWVTYGFRNWTTGHPITAIADAAYTATLADEFIVYTTITTTRILTLPSIAGVVGKTFVVMNQGTASTNNFTITVTPASGQTIGAGGATTASVTNSNAITRFVSYINAAGTASWATW